MSTRFNNAFDYYIRSIVTAILSLGIMGASIYALLEQTNASTALTGWAGLIVGVYFGSHAQLAGYRARGKAAEQDNNLPPQPSE